MKSLKRGNAAPEEVDVLIAGGGPAGICAGIVLAQHGLHTLLCERRAIPVDKACGEGVMPAGAANLKRLGVVRHLTGDGAFPFLGIRYRSPGGNTAAARFAEGPGLGIRRTVLSGALWRRAEKVAGLELHAGTPATPVRRVDGGVLVETPRGCRVKTRLLIGADGLNSRIRRWAGLDGPAQRLKRWGVRRHFRMRPWSEYVEVHWGAGVEAYVTPCGPELVNIALLWDRTRYTNIQGGAGLFPALLEAFPHIRRRLAGVPSLDAPCALGPFHRTARAPVGDGVLLIGDAAGYLDAITGEGISLAVAQALALADTVVPCLQRNAASPGRHDLASYAKAYRRIVRPYYILTRLVLLLSRRPALVERAVRSLDRQPAVFQALLSLNMGHLPPWYAGMGTAVRLVRGMT